MRVHLGGSLNWYDPAKRTWLDLNVDGPLQVVDVARAVGIPVEEIAFAVVNGHIVPVDQTNVADSDRVEFYSPLGGGSLPREEQVPRGQNAASRERRSA